MENMKKLMSRKFIVAVGTLVFIVLTDVLGVNIDESTFNSLVMIVATYILGQGAVDTAIAIKNK